MPIPRLSFGKLVHVSSILMTLLLAMNMHALAGHLKDDTIEADDPAASQAPAPPAAAQPQAAAQEATDDGVPPAERARNVTDGWTSLLPSESGAATPAAARTDTQAPAGAARQATRDCPQGIGCAPPAVARVNQVSDADPEVSQAENDLVKDILARQSDIDSEQKALEEQKHILDAARSALDEKMHDLDTSMATLAERQAAHRETMAAETDRLVRIYEEMPPREAAAVFNIMDIHVLVSVANKMNPRKVSAVMGYMMPERVNLVSQYMAGVRTFHAPHASQDGKPDQDSGNLPWWARSAPAQKPIEQDPLRLSRQ